jgi:hypothetical protein
LEALINVLAQKGLLTNDEVLEELANVVEKQRKRVK